MFSRQIARGQHVDGNAEQFFQFDLEAAEVEQGRTRQRVHQQIEIAIIPIGTMENGTEDTWIGRAKTPDHFTYGDPVPIEYG